MRLIDADALLKSSGYNVRDCSIGAEYIISAPTVDAAPVTHGQWEKIRSPYGTLEGWIHTECGREVKCAENYCPSCGAKMDLPEKENTQ